MTFTRDVRSLASECLLLVTLLVLLASSIVRPVQALHESKKHIFALGVVPILAGIGVIVGVVRMALAFRRRSGAWDRWKLLPPMTNTVAIIVSFAALIVVLAAQLLH